MQIKKHGYAHGRKLYMYINKIGFMAFATCYTMTKRKLYDKEQNSIGISKYFLHLRIMKNQYVI
jgi:hypothetical protein